MPAVCKGHSAAEDAVLMHVAVTQARTRGRQEQTVRALVLAAEQVKKKK
jgi:hypothetical protein